MRDGRQSWRAGDRGRGAIMEVGGQSQRMGQSRGTGGNHRGGG